MEIINLMDDLTLTLEESLIVTAIQINKLTEGVTVDLPPRNSASLFMIDMMNWVSDLYE